MSLARIIQGDSLIELAKLPENSVDAIITDPPYEIGFMGKAHDSTGIAFSVPLWSEVLRVLKPGGHLLAFGGTRTYHRQTVAIEDAGFEIRDCLMWVYGSGFPKSLDVGKSIEAQITTGSSSKSAFKHLDGTKSTTSLGYNKSNGTEGFRPNDYNGRETTKDHVLHTPEGKEWEGWGTALKPSLEPIVLARKPLGEKTVAANVLKWGTGALNIAASRIGSEQITTGYRSTDRTQNVAALGLKDGEDTQHTGRWPANLLLSHNEDCKVVGSAKDTRRGGERTGHFSDIDKDKIAGGNSTGGTMEATTTYDTYECSEGCAVAALDEQSGITKSTPVKPGVRGKMLLSDERSAKAAGMYAAGAPKVGHNHSDKGGASRFFYVAKPGKAERPVGPDGTRHSTVKPVKLMEYLSALITPPGGTILDPFAGSGTTLEAAERLGFKSIGIELTPEYIPLIEQRIQRTLDQQAAARAKQSSQPMLDGLDDAEEA